MPFLWTKEKLSIENIIIPKYARENKDYAFFKCQNLHSIEFYENYQLEQIGEYSFSVTSIETIKTPKEVTSIGQYCFSKCSDLLNLSCFFFFKKIYFV